ncbi:MAG: tyrosine-type recombinase/integrase [Deltaproteobacteria bacterium]|nr:tyrosine-type recombinase/integrase [Deltaproteobacteria bacterium]
MSDFIREYLFESRGRLSQSSLERYGRSFKAFLKYLGDRELEDLSTRLITAFACGRLADGVLPESVNLDLRHVKAALNKAYRWELIPKPVHVEMVRTPKRLPRHLTPEQFQKILDAESIPAFKRLWTFLVWTALRRNEALNLTWDRVTYGPSPHVRVVGKGDQERIVPLMPPAVAALGEPRESGPVFDFKNPVQVTKRFKHTAVKAGLSEHRLHDLRHSGISWLVGRGAPLKLVQDFAGHSTILTTMNYVKIYPGDSYETLLKICGFKDEEK